MIGWPCESNRLDSEKVALANLERSVVWLKLGNWLLNKNLEICVHFWIKHNTEEFELRMVYPHMFPDLPPMIYPVDGSRISNHQYGSGELCLEFRPDNWQSSITGANMVESCQRLISEERPREGTLIHARSAHVASLGREVRFCSFRFLLTSEDINSLNKQEASKSLPLALCSRIVASTLTCSIQYIGLQEKPDMEGNLKKLNGDLEYKGCLVSWFCNSTYK